MIKTLTFVRINFMYHIQWSKLVLHSNHNKNCASLKERLSSMVQRWKCSFLNQEDRRILIKLLLQNTYPPYELFQTTKKKSWKKGLFQVKSNNFNEVVHCSAISILFISPHSRVTTHDNPNAVIPNQFWIKLLLFSKR